jgi:hypothetical protein
MNEELDDSGSEIDHILSDGETEPGDLDDYDRDIEDGIDSELSLMSVG